MPTFQWINSFKSCEHRHHCRRFRFPWSRSWVTYLKCDTGPETHTFGELGVCTNNSNWRFTLGMFKIFGGGGTSECLGNIQQFSTTAIHGLNLQLLGRLCPSRHRPHPRRQTSTRTQGSGSVVSRRSPGPTHFLSTQNVLNWQRSPSTATCRRWWAARGWEITAPPPRIPFCTRSETASSLLWYFSFGKWGIEGCSHIVLISYSSPLCPAVNLSTEPNSEIYL